MKLVDCEQKYWNFVKDLRTDIENQDGFFSVAVISEDGQKKFMSENHQNYKICISEEGDPLGYVGIINNNEITYCVHPKYKGRGIGTFMVSAFGQKNDNILALVKPENIASQKVFEKLNWDKKILYTKK